MRHTRLFRFMTALFGVWFTVTLVQPNGMMGMTMSGSGASMDMSSAGGSSMPASSMPSMHMGDTDMTAAQMASMQMSMHTSPAAPQIADDSAPAQSKTSPECDQHDCCCSALSIVPLVPSATLAWLPEHIVNQETPQRDNDVVHTDGQLLLPFANGPPRTVTA